MTGLRITGGDLRGRRISLPPGDVRPTSGRAREAFFNIVGARIEGSLFLDLFAGSGIFSFEAVSRGAVRAIAIEKSRKAVRQIEWIATDWRVPVTAIDSDALVGLRHLPEDTRITVGYADPPYAYPAYGELARTLDEGGFLGVGAIIGIEHRKGALPFDPAALRNLRLKRTVAYSDVAISLLEVPSD